METESELSLAPFVLHGTWTNGQFFLWVETSELRPRRGRQAKLPLHPHSAPPALLRDALHTLLPGELGEYVGMPAERVLLLPTDHEEPLLPPWMSSEARDEAGTAPELAPWRVPGVVQGILAALDILVAVPQAGGDRRWGPDLRYWSTAAKLGLEMLARQQSLPGLTESDGRFRAVWLPVMNDAQDRARLKALATSMPPVCRAVFGVKETPEGAGHQPHAVLDAFFKALWDQAMRKWGRPNLNKRLKLRSDTASIWWEALWATDGAMKLGVWQRDQMAGLYDAWRTWSDQVRGAAEAAFRLCFRLEPPQTDPATGAILSPDWTLRYFLQARDDPSLIAPLDLVWKARGSTLEYLEYRFEHAQEQALAGLGLAARLCPPIMASLRTKLPEACTLTMDEAYAFLREVGPLLEESGFGILVPPWWSKSGARLGVRGRASLKSNADVVGSGILSLDSLVEFDWELALGGEPLTREEFERLAALKVPLVQVRGQWVLLQREDIEAAITFWERQKQRQEMALRDALSLALGADDHINGLPLQELEACGSFQDLLTQLEAGDKLQPLPPPEGFCGELRPYQLRGLSWLAFLRKWGFGGCLADDMGLGKTIETLALLLHERAEADGAKPALLVCPTSVVGNWEREASRFAPRLRVMVHHGGERERGEAFAEAAQRHDLVITSYGLVRRDAETLAEIQWGDVILDEAQNIKNPHAKQTQAVRSLPAENRVALTGTPVENRLSELWSIMHFLNPGYLGSQARFRENFAIPIERYQDTSAATHLKSLVEPFVLRRVKTDPTIIQDLPLKSESKVYCSLTQEQATLYQAVVDESLHKIGEAEAKQESAFSRRGAVLAALLRLKQVCNHPAQYLGDGSAMQGRSGKLERLTEMLEEVLEVGDHALIFTQFAEMGEMLQRYLQPHFGVEVLYLHGGTAQKQRDRMVARFQEEGGPPLFILSLKAGGTGLNLTAANHVFHFDRWWNPAVEDQATDRAYRIGQQRNVLVHKFICGGTLEDKIDALIESKKALAASVVSAGEDWLTELGSDELRELIALQARD